MATTPKKAAAVKKPVPAVKPKAPAIALQNEQEDAATYTVTGRILRNGETLRPGDSVDLTEREAFDLRGFIEPADPLDADEGGKAESPTE